VIQDELFGTGSTRCSPQPSTNIGYLASVRKACDRVSDALGLRGATYLCHLRHIFATRSIPSGCILERRFGGLWRDIR
jgi:hypothetical protein